MDARSLIADEPGAILRGAAAAEAKLPGGQSLVDVEAALQAAQESFASQLNTPTRQLSEAAWVGAAGNAARGAQRAEFGTPAQQPTGTFLSYELGPRIGAGGMGTVHQARHVWLGRTVAIKFISPALLDSPDMIERFRHEALAIGRLAHPNIVQATDAGRFNGVHYLVTEFVPGADLASIVRKHGWLEVCDACEAVRQAALGLAHAHECGIVHRDVKPGNLLLSTDGTVKLLDFGLARLAAGKTTLTNTGQILGTLDFLAPEQANDARLVDPRGDQYSLGCTLFYLLAGEAPFSGPAYDTPASKLKAHLVDQPRNVRELRQRVPLALSAVLERMMAKDPAQRYVSVLDAAEALAPFCRSADLAALVGGRTSDERHRCRGEGRVYSACGELVERAAAVLGWVLTRGASRQQANAYLGQPVQRRQPALSITGIVLLGLIAFGLSKISCVEILEEGPQGPDGKPTQAKLIEFGFGNVALPGVEPKKGR